MSRLNEIPKELVVDYDHIHGPEISVFPPSAVDGFREDLRAFYSSRHGGFWVLTRYEDIRAAFRDHELFVQHAQGLPLNPYSRIHIPLMLNEPDHGIYRKLMVPIFAPRMVARLEEVVRTVAKEQIARIASLGECEFVDDFAISMPSAMYCGMLGVDPSNFRKFNDLSVGLVFGAADVLLQEGEDAARHYRKSVSEEIDEILLDLIAQRKSQPGDDIISILLDADLGDRKLTDDEVLNMASLLFFAGTASTTSMMTYAFMFLAQNPEHRQQIIDNPSLTRQAATEMIRYHGFHQIRREVARDTTFAGVEMKKGDIILLPTGGANHDPRQFPDPHVIDFSRSNAQTHLSFGGGVHQCIGQHLATLEIMTALQEFHAVIKDYRLHPDKPVKYMTSQAKAVPRYVPMTFTPVTVAPQ
ncbi:cytochrome P450 [Pseudomonas sp. NFX224]|uniref:cytochrome P450 n=1 Tax=Pseudomonas sp. NFX224 TaxID=3402862 RepID=UPI003AFB3F11